MTAGESDQKTHKNELPDKGKGLPAKRAGSEQDMAAAILVCHQRVRRADRIVSGKLRRLLVSRSIFECRVADITASTVKPSVRLSFIELSNH